MPVIINNSVYDIPFHIFKQSPKFKFFSSFSLVKNAVVNILGYFLITSLAYISGRELLGPEHILMALVKLASRNVM